MTLARLPWYVRACGCLAQSSSAGFGPPWRQLSRLQQPWLLVGDVVRARCAQARNVTGFQPEGMHLTPWQWADGGWSLLVSWQTGGERGLGRQPAGLRHTGEAG